MNIRVRSAWLKAMRSGEYLHNNTNMKKKKGKGTTCYSALGLLCKITGNENNRDMNSIYPRMDKNGNALEFAGITPSMQTRIATMDRMASSYDDVARYISKNLKTTK